MLNTGFLKVKIKQSLDRPIKSPEDSRGMRLPDLNAIGT
jgi:hypothetical protein